MSIHFQESGPGRHPSAPRAPTSRGADGLKGVYRSSKTSGHPRAGAAVTTEEHANLFSGSALGGA